MWYVIKSGNDLYHHGIKGQKWGKRRFQNEDGSLTPEGMARYRRKEARRQLRREAIKKEFMRDRRNEKAKKRKEALTAISGVAVSAALVSATIAYASHKDQIDSAILNLGTKAVVKVASDAYDVEKKIVGKSLNVIGDVSLQMLKTVTV